MWEKAKLKVGGCMCRVRTQQGSDLIGGETKQDMLMLKGVTSLF